MPTPEILADHGLLFLAIDWRDRFEGEFGMHEAVSARRILINNVISKKSFVPQKACRKGEAELEVLFKKNSAELKNGETDFSLS